MHKIIIGALAAASFWDSGLAIGLAQNATPVGPVPDPQFIQKFSGDAFDLAFARIESHYFFNRGFFESDGWLLDNIDKIRSVPCVIVQGRYDVVCPMTSAWDLKKAFPEAELVIVPDAGHSAQEPGIISGLVTATNKFRELPH